MAKYNTGDRSYDLTNFLNDTNDCAWAIVNREEIDLNSYVEPIYPLNWFICYGKAPKEFIDKLLKSSPRKIARIIIRNWEDDSSDIIRKIEQSI